MRTTAAPKVVFVGHSASPTGAPIVLLHLVRWLRREAGLPGELFLLDGGPLVVPFAESVPTSVVGAGPLRSRLLKAIERSADRLLRREARVPARLPQLPGVRKLASECGRADLVYVNSIAAASVLLELTSRPKVILHLHEMSYALEQEAARSPTRVGMTTEEYLQAAFRRASTVIVPSEATRRQAVAVAPFMADRCRVIPEMIDIASVRASGHDPKQVRSELGIPAGALVVTACGRFDWRKGPDLFLQVAARVIPAIRAHPVYFVWIGARRRPPTGAYAWSFLRQFEWEVRSLGLQERVILVPPTSDPAAYIDAGDLFLLPSREDPFPLVAIEAAALGKPVVCFASSGTAEMIRSDAGAVVPHLDVPAMAAAVQTLLEDRELRRSTAAVAANRAAEYDVARVAPLVHAEIERLVH